MTLIDSYMVASVVFQKKGIVRHMCMTLPGLISIPKGTREYIIITHKLYYNYAFPVSSRGDTNNQ